MPRAPNDNSKYGKLRVWLVALLLPLHTERKLQALRDF
jgi:hypothetical protein